MFDFTVKNGFGSDNHSGVHPEMLQAIVDCNKGHLPSYGTDAVCTQAQKAFDQLFAKPCQAFFVFNGTAANTLAMKAMTRGFHSVICSENAHLHHDECGAPEAIAHCKLIPLPAEHGKIAAQQIEEALIRRGDQHATQAKVVSITQPTELGTVYSIDEIKDIVQVAHKNEMYVHVDGARIANAVTYLKTSFAEMISETGIDAVSFGGTKNGFLFGEAVVFFDKELAKDFKYIRKQGLNLPSKSRFIAAQFVRYFKDELWRGLSQQAIDLANYLGESLSNVEGIEISQPVQSNVVFVKIPKAWVKKLRESYFFYVWDEKTFECRIMMSFDNTKEDVDQFVELLRRQNA